MPMPKFVFSDKPQFDGWNVWLNDLLGEHADDIAQRGQSYVNRVRMLYYEANLNSIRAEIAGSGTCSYSVRLELPVAMRGNGRDAGAVADDGRAEQSLDRLRRYWPLNHQAHEAACSCPFSNDGQFLCKHTFAVAAHLQQRLAIHAATGAAVFEMVTSNLDGADSRSSGFGAKSQAAERLLECLDQTIGQLDLAVLPLNRAVKRICWVASEHRGGPFGMGLKFTPYWEHFDGEHWQRHGKLGWEEFACLPRELLNAQDRAAAQLVTQEQAGFSAKRRGIWTAKMFDIAVALIGHPRLFLADGTSEPVAVRDGRAGLSVLSREEGFLVGLAVDGEPLPQSTDCWQSYLVARGLLIVNRVAQRLSIIETSPAVRDLFAKLKPAVVPNDEWPTLRERLDRLENVLPITWVNGPPQVDLTASVRGGRRVPENVSRRSGAVRAF